jgi:hypothetical protein
MLSTYALRNATVILSEGIVTNQLYLAAGRVVAEPVPGAWELDLRDHLIFPGLVNAHDHLQLNNIPPLPQHDPFPNSYAWIAAFQSYFDDPAVATAIAVSKTLRHWQGGLKNLLCGATTVAHHDPWDSTLDDAAFPVNLLRHFGWSHSLGLAGPAGDERRSAVLSLRPVLPKYGPPVLESFAATPPDQPWIIHLAEGADEVAAAELGQLETLGCLAANTVLVHGVGLTLADVQSVIQRGAAVVWCPASNLSMLGKTLNPRVLFEAGRLALGSDSRISGSRDLLDELRVAAAHSNLKPAELLQLVTIGGSRLLAMHDVGDLDRGKRADMLIVGDSGTDPYRTLLDLQRRDIRAVVRDGAPAIADPDFAEWFAACEVEAIAVLLDGRPKLLARRFVGPLGAAALEPGLELLGDTALPTICNLQSAMDRV